MFFRRKIYAQLQDWKKRWDGRTALLLEGQRRVGKSTVVEKFAQEEYKSYIRIDFSNCSSEIKNLFEDVSDLDYIFLQLQLFSGKRLYERESAIIFDEVQLCPKARQAIKHLVKDHRYDYMETGSLISIKKNTQGVLIPSEETRLSMYPMDFEEFLWAQGKDSICPILRQFYEKEKPVGEIHRQMMRQFRLYMLVGGMPQAVEAYLQQNNFEDVDAVKRNILDLYEDDFRKIDETGRLSAMFDAIPAQLSRNAYRYSVSNVDANLRPNNVLELIAELADSRTVLVAYHVHDPSAGMALTKDLSQFKLFLSDIGLFVTLAFKDKSFTENIIYKKLLSDKLPANLGYFFENVVAQTLAAAGNQLYYHTFPDKTGNNRYEIDFLLAKRDKVCPIEVKSSGYKRHASLDAFGKKYGQHIDRKYLIYTKDLQKDQDILCLPVYMAQFL